MVPVRQIRLWHRQVHGFLAMLKFSEDLCPPSLIKLYAIYELFPGSKYGVVTCWPQIPLKYRVHPTVHFNVPINLISSSSAIKYTKLSDEVTQSAG